jgi:tetratricopeptide (TPR) repeat protein
LLRAKRDRDRAAAAQADAEQVSRFLADMLRTTDPKLARGARTVRDLLDRTVRKLDAGALHDQPLVEAEVRMTVGGAYHSLSMPAESRSQVEQALSIRRRLLGDGDRRTADSMSLLGDILWAANDLEGAEQWLGRALAAQEKLSPPSDAETVRTMLRLSLALGARRDLPGAEAVLRRARELTLRRPVPPELEARVLSRLGEELILKSDWAEGDALLRAGVELQRRSGQGASQEAALDLLRLARFRKMHGDLDGARADCLSAMGIQREVLPPDHVDVAQALRLLALISSEQGDNAEAEKHLREALGILERVGGPHGAGVAQTADEVALALSSNGRRADAAAMRRRAADARLAGHLEELARHPGTAFHVGGVGEARVRRCEFTQGARDLAEACRLDGRDPRWWFILASVQNYLGQRDACRETCRQILERFGESASGQEQMIAARACLLADESPPATELRLLGRMAQRAQGLPYAPRGEALAFCRGLAALRAGHHDKAAELFTWSRNYSDWGPPRFATQFYLAVALRRAGHPAAAGVAMWVALRQYGDAPRVDEGDIGVYVDDWLLCQIARREAVGEFFPEGLRATAWAPAPPAVLRPAIATGWRKLFGDE